jgi:menaquinol-cytochrome c reductase iron-sulfur subunit
MNKRTFSKFLIAGGGIVVSGVVGIPAFLAALSPSLRRDNKANWQPVGHIDDFKEGVMTKAVVPVPREDWAQSLRNKGVFVLRGAAEKVIVFSRNCTDLSCPLAWDPGSGWFFCPCHGGIFSEQGEPKAGPPKDPLFRYSYRIRNRILEIDLNSIPPMA